MAVSVKGKALLILRVTQETDPYHAVAVGTAWWGNPRLESTPIDHGIEVDPPVVTNKILRFDSKEYNAALKEMVAKIKKKFDGNAQADKPSLALSLFSLSPLPGQTLADKNATDLQSDLQVELSNAEAFTLTIGGDAFNKVLAENKAGLDDNFDEKTRVALGKLVKAQYLLLGKISDGEDHATITLSLYELRTGILRVASRVEIPLLKKGVDPPNTQDPHPAGLTDVSLEFTSDDELHVEDFEWFMDGKPIDQDATTRSHGIATTTSVPPGKHKFRLKWTGKGFHNEHAQRFDYKIVSTEFEMNIGDSASVIELTAKLTTGLSVKLDLTVHCGDLEFHPGWR